jgi:hypothetical protein
VKAVAQFTTLAHSVSTFVVAHESTMDQHDTVCQFVFKVPLLSVTWDVLKSVVSCNVQTPPTQLNVTALQSVTVFVVTVLPELVDLKVIIPLNVLVIQLTSDRLP